MIKDHKDLKVWQKAYELVLEVYKVTKRFPDDERYNLTIQSRRSALSIPSNIAEGHARGSRQQYLYALYVAFGSTKELETQILLAHDLGYLYKEIHEKLIIQINEVSKMLRALIHSLEKK